jgi:hypothetical protein
MAHAAKVSTRHVSHARPATTSASTSRGCVLCQLDLRVVSPLAQVGLVERKGETGEARQGRREGKPRDQG